MEKSNFGWALSKLKAGYAVFREGWNGPGQWLRLREPDDGSRMTLPYIYIRTVQGDLVPWLASQTDLLACDWESMETVEPAPINPRQG